MINHIISNELKLCALLSQPQLQASQISEVAALIPQIETNKFQYQLDQHRIWPSVYCNIRDHCSELFTPSLTDYLKQKYRQNINSSQRQFLATTSILQSFKAANIPVKVIKGLPLAQRLYGDIAKRHCNDIDMLIPKDYRHIAHQHLSQLGYQCDVLNTFSSTAIETLLECRKDLAYRGKRGILLELHLRLTGHSGLLTKDYTQQIFSDSSLEYEQKVREFVYLCWHATYTLHHRLKWLQDIALYIKNGAANTPRFFEDAVIYAQKTDTLRSLVISMILSNILYKTDTPPAVSSFYKKDFISKIVLKASLNTLNQYSYKNSIRYELEMHIYNILLPQQWLEKIRILWQAFKPNSDEIELLSKMPVGRSFFCYLIRPFRLFYRKVLNRNSRPQTRGSSDK